MASAKLDWKGDEVIKDTVAAIVDGLDEYGLRVETTARGSVKPGRGVVTGTYRRSIHSAHVGYSFKSDNVQPSSSSPDRGGGRGAQAQIVGAKVSIQVGSGMIYAMSLENLYNVIRGAHDKESSKLGDIIQKHAAKRGLL